MEKDGAALLLLLFVLVLAMLGAVLFVTGSFRHFPLPPGIAEHLRLSGERVPREFGAEAETDEAPVREANA